MKIDKLKFLGFLSASGVKFNGLNFPTFALAALIVNREIPKRSSFFIVPSIMFLIFLLIHLLIGNIILVDFFKNIIRLVFPFMIPMFLVENIMNRDDSSGGCDLLKFAVGILFFCSLDIIPAILLNFSDYIQSILSENIYFIKDKNLFLQNTNYTAFFAFVAAFAVVVSHEIYGTRANHIIIFAILISILCMSRAYIISLIVILFIQNSPLLIQKFLTSRICSLIFFFCFIFFQIYIVFSLTISDEFINYVRTEIDGSAATKLEIAIYTSSIISKYGPDILIGLGPQVIDLDVMKTYASHSLVGVFSELGLFILIYLMPFFLLALRRPKFFFYNLGFYNISLSASFPAAYLASWLMVVYFVLFSERVDN